MLNLYIQHVHFLGVRSLGLNNDLGLHISHYAGRSGGSSISRRGVGGGAWTPDHPFFGENGCEKRIGSHGGGGGRAPGMPPPPRSANGT